MLARAWTRTRNELFVPTFGNEELPALAAVDLYSRRLVRYLQASCAASGAVAGCRFGNFATELAARDEEIRRRIAGIFAEMQALVAGSIERGIAAGELAASLDAREAARDFIALMEGRMVLAKTTGNPKELAALRPAARRLLQPVPKEGIT
jgi:hypothetical protein